MRDAHTLYITAGSGNSFKPMLVLRQRGDAGPAEKVRIRSVDVLAGAGVGWLAGTAGAWFIFRFPDLWQTPRFRTLIGLALCATGMWLLNRPLDYPLGYFTVYVAAACSVLSVVDMFLRVGVER